MPRTPKTVKCWNCGRMNTAAAKVCPVCNRRLRLVRRARYMTIMCGCGEFNWVSKGFPPRPCRGCGRMVKA